MAGFPAITGALAPSFCSELIFFVQRRRKSWLQVLSPNDTLIILILSYVVLHSISAHKEFRFLLPILPFVCIISGINLNSFTTRDEKKFDSRRPYFRKMFFIISFLLALNFPHLYFLSSVHQRASIDINRQIADRIGHAIKTSWADSDQVFYVHYLMSCHSTPLYSHLHVPVNMSDGTKRASSIMAWTLDCSPECRKDSTISCESDEFLNNPSRFMERSYFSANQECDKRDSSFCTVTKETPHFLVISEDSQDFENLRKRARALGMIESEKIRQQIKHIRIRHKERIIHDFFVGNILEITFNHYYLYIRQDLPAL